MPKGYVYILTNPSFRENWVKIGKTSRPVDVRSKELDNTAVPLPYEVFAVLETEKYIQAEEHIHKMIKDKRIRKSREFFNTPPQSAAEIFESVVKLLEKEACVVYSKDKMPKENKMKSVSSTDSIIGAENRNSANVAVDNTYAQTSSYTLDKHLNKCNDTIKRFFEKHIRNFILKMSETIKEEPTKRYIAYKTKDSKNFMCIAIKKDKLLLFLKINPIEMKKMPENCRNMTNVEHDGTGNFEITIKNIRNVADSEKYIKMAFENVGG